jgi:hypothetical protein
MQRLTIAISGSADESGNNATLITRLLADGKALRADNIATSGSWISYWDRTLSHPNTREPASISFNASSAAVMFDRLGHCGYLSISGPGRLIWRDNCDTRGDRIAVDLPSPMRKPGASFVLCLAVFLALAGTIRPWTARRRADIWLLIHLGVVHLLFWATQPVGLLHDSLKQLPTLDANLLGAAGYFPPGYPILVGVGHLVWPTRVGSAVAMVQHAMMVAAIWWCYRLLERSAGTTISFAAALVTGAAAPALIVPQGLLSENVALFGMTGGLYFAARYRQSARLRDGAVSGLMLGWAALARIVPLAAGLPALFVVLIYGESARGVAMRRCATVLTLFSITMAAPILWFGAKSGHFTLSNAAGFHLYNRVIADQGLLDPNTPAASRLLALIAPANPDGEPHWKIAPMLGKKGLSYAEAEELMRRAALEGIRRSPWKYIGYSFRQAWNQYFLNPDVFMPYASNPFDYPGELESPPPLGVSADSLLWRQRLEDAFEIAWRYVPWLGLASLPLIPWLEEQAIFMALAIMPAGYIVATAFVEYLLSRYNAAIVPFIFMLAGGAIAGVIRVATATWRVGFARRMPRAAN